MAFITLSLGKNDESKPSIPQSTWGRNLLKWNMKNLLEIYNTSMSFIAPIECLDGWRGNSAPDCNIYWDGVWSNGIMSLDAYSSVSDIGALIVYIMAIFN